MGFMLIMNMLKRNLLILLYGLYVCSFVSVCLIDMYWGKEGATSLWLLG